MCANIYLESECSLAVEHVATAVDDPAEGVPKMVVPGRTALLQDLHESVRTPSTFFVLIFGCFIGQVVNVLPLSCLLPACQFLLKCL